MVLMAPMSARLSGILAVMSISVQGLNPRTSLLGNLPKTSDKLLFRLCYSVGRINVQLGESKVLV